LVQRFGTPSFVYSFARVRDNLERLHAALAAAEIGGGYNVLYAMKANRFARCSQVFSNPGSVA
jgi:diaminopimelate decarboxylase